MALSLRLRYMSIKAKISLVISVLIIALLINVGFSSYKMNQIGEEIVTIAEEDIPLTRSLTEITINQLEQAINFERALRFAIESEHNSAAAEHIKPVISAFNKHSELIETEIDHGISIAKHGMQKAHNDKQHQEFKHVSELLEKIKTEHKDYEKHVHHSFELINNGQIQQAIAGAEKIEKEEEQIDHELEALLLEIEEFTEEAALKAEHDEQSALKWQMIIAVISLMIGLPLAYIITTEIIRGLNKAVFLANHVAEGDLTHNIEFVRTDEIGQLLKALVNMQANRAVDLR